MAYNSTYDLLGKKVSDTYPSLLQSGSDGLFYDGRGNSVIINATIPDIYVLTSSFNNFTSSYNTGSFTGSFTGSLLGTASYALNGGVTQLLAGPNITLSPTNGLGQVTISSTGGGGSSFNTATGSYGSFYDTTTQTNPVGNVPRSMSLNTTAITNGVSVSGSTDPFNTYIKTENAGVYNIQFSAQLDKTDSGTDDIVIWLRKNGIDLIDTATTISLVGNNAKNVAAWNWFVNSAANDYYQLIWYSADTDLRLLAETMGGGHPGIPSVIVTANRVDQFLSNTGSFSGSFTGQFTGSLSGTGSWANNAVTASYADTLDGIDSTQFARVDIDNTFNGVNTVTQKTLRDNSSYVIAETSISSDEITGPGTQSIEVFNVYQYVTYTTDRPALNTAATFDYTIFDNTLVAIRSGRVNLSWTPNTPGQEAITDTQTIVDPVESINITFNSSVDYSIGTEFVKLNVLNGASKPIYIRGFLRII
jgi:hypothetical protein